MKRYVLLEDKTIIKVNKDDYEIFVNTISFGDTQLGQIKLQSDNLLDLAEVGDYYEDLAEVLHYIDMQVLGQFHDYIALGIIALWKRNGDIMRRYER